MSKKTKEYYITKLINHGDTRTHGTLERKTLKELKTELLRYESEKVGRPRIVETPEELMNLFKEYMEYEDEKELLTINAFMKFLKYEKELITTMYYWYDLNEEFSHVKKEIEMLMEDRLIKLGGDRDKATSFLIFFAKNKFNYTDKQEIEQTQKQSITIVNDLEEE